MKLLGRVLPVHVHNKYKGCIFDNMYFIFQVFILGEKLETCFVLRVLSLFSYVHVCLGLQCNLLILGSKCVCVCVWVHACVCVWLCFRCDMVCKYWGSCWKVWLATGSELCDSGSYAISDVSHWCSSQQKYHANMHVFQGYVYNIKHNVICILVKSITQKYEVKLFHNEVLGMLWELDQFFRGNVQYRYCISWVWYGNCNVM